MNFEERVADIIELFSLRNAMYMRGDMRVLFLTDSIRRLGKLIRNSEEDKVKLSHALASVFARTCAVADSFVNLPITDALCEKYPCDMCAYCQLSQCNCAQKRRTEIAYARISDMQRLWGVNEWCIHLHNVYGENNQKRGMGFAQSRLTEEVMEVISAQLVDIYNRTLTPEQVRQNIAREFADVFAWIFSMSAMIGINLDSVLEERYPRSHRRCGKRPCNCGPYYLYQTDDSIRVPGEVHPETRVSE